MEILITLTDRNIEHLKIPIFNYNITQFKIIFIE